MAGLAAAALVLAVLSGTAGWHAHHLRTRAAVRAIYAARTAIGDPGHLRQAVAHHARRLHIRLDSTR